MSGAEAQTYDDRSAPGLAIGLTLVFAPLATLAVVMSLTGSSVLASASALSLSPALQLAAESRWPARRVPPPVPGQRRREILQGVVYGTVLGVGTVLAVAGLVGAAKRALGFTASSGFAPWSEALILVVVADFLDYFRHRHEHESNGLFWRVHSVHHSLRHFSLLTGLVLHPLEPVFTFASYGLVAGLFSFSFDGTVLGFTLALIAMGAQHTNTPTRLGLLSNVLAHADGHRWHHDLALSTGRNVNYANVFSIWDRLWGTFQPAAPFAGEYGIEPFRDAYPAGLIEQARMALPGDYARAEAGRGGQ
jgi:sterol desaturase/sphingolipid hydroxylase (fatty acid hydroxylase superfamily)